MAKKKNRWEKLGYFIVKTLVFMAVSIYALLSVYGYKFNPTDHSFSQVGVIEIRAYPSNVNIFLDNVYTSTSSPYELRDVDVGHREVRLESAGFTPLILETDVGNLLVVRFGNLFLLPLNAWQYVSRLWQGTFQYFSTEEAIVIFFPDVKIVYRMDKKTGDIQQKNITLSEPVQQVVFLKNTWWYIGKTMMENDQGQFYTVPFSVKKIADAQRDYFLQGRSFLYVISDDGKLNLLNLLTGDITLIKTIFPIIHVSDNLVYGCDTTGGVVMELLSDAQKQEKPPSGHGGPVESNLWTTVPGLNCTIDTVYTIMDKQLFEGNQTLWFNNKVIDTHVSSLLPEKDAIVYATNSGWYRYDVIHNKRILLNRFSSTISDITHGPTDSTYFLVIQNKLLFCDIKNKDCRDVGMMPFSIVALHYIDEEKKLILISHAGVYTMDFSFWK